MSQPVRILPEWARGRGAYVYRYYDRYGMLLYVGCTNCFWPRDNSHRQTQRWYHEVAWTEVWSYSSIEEAADAELAALRSENPMFNRSKRARYTRMERR